MQVSLSGTMPRTDKLICLCPSGGMVDTEDLKSSARESVWVRLPPWAELLYYSSRRYNNMDNYNYWTDGRVQSQMYSSPYKVNERKGTITFKDSILEEIQEEGILIEKTIDVDFKYKVCGECDGSGRVVDPNIDASGITEEDFGEDPEFREDYFAGRYDRTCGSCKGLRVLTLPVIPNNIQKIVDEWNDNQIREIKAICLERALGC